LYNNEVPDFIILKPKTMKISQGRQVVRCVPETYGTHRYLLEVKLSDCPALNPRLAVILKNPSTASAVKSDPTIGKVEAWARRRNFASLLYVNLFAVRSTQPAPLNDWDYAYTVGPENDYYIREAAAQADTVVLAWGNSNGIDPRRYDRRIREVLALLADYRLQVVGQPTRLGYPRHGLLWNNQPELSDFRPKLSDFRFET
jgi:hypothetical protein